MFKPNATPLPAPPGFPTAELTEHKSQCSKERIELFALGHCYSLQECIARSGDTESAPSLVAVLSLCHVAFWGIRN